jgi:hypothetical protein
VVYPEGLPALVELADSRGDGSYGCVVLLHGLKPGVVFVLGEGVFFRCDVAAQPLK